MCGSWRGENGRVGETQCDMVRTRAASIGFESNRARVSGTLAQGQRGREPGRKSVAGVAEVAAAAAVVGAAGQELGEQGKEQESDEVGLGERRGRGKRWQEVQEQGQVKAREEQG